MTLRSTPLDPEPIDRTSPTLAVVGFLMAVAVLLNANPKFGVHPMWPWEMLAHSGATLATRAIALIWMFTSVWLLVLSFGPWYRLRSTIAVILALVLVTELEGVYGGMQIRRFFLNEFLPLIGIGAGLLYGRRPESRKLGAYLCGISVIALIVAWGVGFESIPKRGLVPRFAAYAHELRVFFTGGTYWAETQAQDPGYPWHTLMPQLLMFLAAGGALVFALGVRTRLLATLSFVVLLIGIAAPIGVRIVRVLEASDPAFTSIALHIVAGLIDDGIVVWMLACFAIADLVRHDPADAAWEAS